MPFSDLKDIKQEEWSEIYTELFSKAVEEPDLGYSCERSDVRNGAFTKDIVQNLKNADVVLADITYFNGNVMWELGVRHSLSNRTIIVARDNVMDEKIISDAANYGVIPYEPTNLKKVNEFKKKIKMILEKMDEDPDRTDSPVLDYINDENITMSNFEKKQIVNNVMGLISELFVNLELIDDMLEGDQPLKKNELTTNRFHSDAVDYLFISNYVTLKLKLRQDLRLLQELFIRTNKFMDLSSEELHTKTVPEYLIDHITQNLKLMKTKVPKTLNAINELYKDLESGIYVYSEPTFIAHQSYINYYTKLNDTKKTKN